MSPITVTPTTHELSSSVLSSEHLEDALHAIHTDGLVIIANAIPHDMLSALNNRMLSDADTLRNKPPSTMPFNFNQSNLQQDPPPTKEYFFPEVFLNPFVTQIVSHVLGPRPSLRFLSGNTAMPAAPGVQPQRQPVHSDADCFHPTHPFALVVNVPLIDMTVTNGSTEVWLGTQRYSYESQECKANGRPDGQIKPEMVEQRRDERPPWQPIVNKGSIVIRDLRLWHAGMPNRSDAARVMLAMVLFASWYRNKMTLELGEGCRDVVGDGKGLNVPVRWVGDEEVERTYLERGPGFADKYDFGQTDEKGAARL